MENASVRLPVNTGLSHLSEIHCFRALILCRTDMGSAAANRSPEEGAASILWPFTNFTAQLNGAYLDDQGVAFDDQEA